MLRWATVAIVSLLIHALLLAWLGLRAPRPQYQTPVDPNVIEMQLSAEIVARLRREAPARKPPRGLRLPAPFAPEPPALHVPPSPPPSAPAPESVVVDLRAALKRAGIGCAMTLKGDELADCQARLAARTLARGAKPLPATAGVAPDKLAPWNAAAARKDAARRAWDDVGNTPGVWNSHIGKELPTDRPMPTKNDPKGCVAVVCEP